MSAQEMCLRTNTYFGGRGGGYEHGWLPSDHPALQSGNINYRLRMEIFQNFCVYILNW